MRYKVAVTGVGGGSGQGILTSLLMSKHLVEVYPVDVTPISAGLYWPGCMPGTVLPKPEQDIEAWKAWLVTNDIDLLIPGSDYDLPPLAALAEKWRGRGLPRIAVSNPRLVDVANDKWKTVSTLGSLGIPAPVSCTDDLEFAVSWADDLYPVVLKPCNDAASRGLHICRDVQELCYYWRETTNPIVQEYLDGDEYTCALFYDIDHNLRAVFAMRRWLYAGNTYRAEVVEDQVLTDWLWENGRKLRPLNPFGPINLQLRIVPDRGPVVFEINARCSGSTGIRAHWGYNEADMLVSHILDRAPVNQPRTRKGFTFRHYQDIHLDDKTIHQLVMPPEPTPAENPPGSTTL